jgi:chromosome segregation ATPase
MAASNVEKELESLRKEIAGLRQDYTRLKGRARATKSDAAARFTAIGDELSNTIEAVKDSVSKGLSAEEIGAQLDELRGVVNNYSEKTEETIAAHPFATLAGALFVGYLVGRLGR